MSAKKVAIINMKGGVGKTTLSINLGWYLSEINKKKVLLIDLDPQANATIVGTDPEGLIKYRKDKKTIADLFINCYKQYGPFSKNDDYNINYKEYIYRIYESDDKQSYLDLVPSEIYLSSVLRGVYLGPYDLNELLINEVEKIYDFIIVDCAPTYSILTTLALNATKSVLIPVMADSFGIYGVDLMKHVLDEHKYDYGFHVKIIGLIFTMFDKKIKHQIASQNKIIKSWGPKNTFKTSISKNEWYKVANGKRDSFLKTPAHDKNKQEFINFVNEFNQRIG